MMIQAVLSNPNHPKYGVATIPFPIPRDQYTYCMELLAALEIGDAVKADCKVEKVDSFFSVLKRTEMLTVNVEELNYLAKRLDSFDTGEAAQFQAMAHKLELFELKDLINLTFCCQQATVITDFSDLDAVGRDHYMNLHGGSASVDELNKLDGKGTARQLIESGSGTVTPYGVVYDNGMKLEQVYDGRFFPCYYYEPNAITVAVTSKAEPEDTEHITWLYLPMEREEIDRALLRGGITDPADVRLRLEDSQLPNEVDVLLDLEYETLSDLNELAEATDGLSNADMEKLGAVVKLQEAIVRAVNKFNEQDNATYKALMRATISEALGLNGDPEEVDMLERKIEALNNKMLTLVNESVSSGDGIEAHESEFMTLSQETELLKQRIAAIQESAAKDNGEQNRLEQIQAIIAERESKCMEYDDSIVRQMVECIKVYPDGKLAIIFGGGYLVEESV